MKSGLKITGGEFNGRIIKAPKNLQTRPTQSRLRQALFNSLQAEIPDAQVLDLFAGSGALGFEALSRGASQVLFVEESRSAARLISENAKELNVESRVDLICEDLARAWSRISKQGPFHLVLADPPYAGDWESKILKGPPWDQILDSSGFLCLEWGIQKSKVQDLPERVPFLVKVREKNYGDSVLSTYERQKGEEEPACPSQGIINPGP